MNQNINQARIVNIHDVTFHEPTDRDERLVTRRKRIATLVLTVFFTVWIIFFTIQEHLFTGNLRFIIPVFTILLDVLFLLGGRKKPKIEVCYGTLLDQRADMKRKHTRTYYTFSLDDTGEIVKELKIEAPWNAPCTGDHIMITRERKKGNKVHYELFKI